MADTLVALSTGPLRVSYRDPILGSVFIRTIAQVFMKNAHDTDLRDMLDIVSREMADWEDTANVRRGKEPGLVRVEARQQPELSARGWYKKLYFNPGL